MNRKDGFLFLTLRSGIGFRRLFLSAVGGNKGEVGPSEKILFSSFNAIGFVGVNGVNEGVMGVNEGVIGVFKSRAVIFVDSLDNSMWNILLAGRSISSTRSEDINFQNIYEGLLPFL